MKRFTKQPISAITISVGNDLPLHVGDRIREMYADPWRVGTILELLPDGYAKVEWDYSDGDDIEVVDATYLEPWDEFSEELKDEAAQIHDDLKQFYRKLFQVSNIDEYITDNEFSSLRSAITILEDLSIRMED